jgi:hypothetical protein
MVLFLFLPFLETCFLPPTLLSNAAKGEHENPQTTQHHPTNRHSPNSKGGMENTPGHHRQQKESTHRSQRSNEERLHGISPWLLVRID